MAGNTKPRRGHLRSTAQARPTEEALAEMSVEELNAYAEEAFDWEHPEPLEPRAPRRLDASISVRFSRDELDQIRARAEAAGTKVTAYIRAVVLQHQTADVVDLAAVRGLLATIAREVHELESQLG